ncbi:MAG: glycine cleavage system protein GcvH, partial [Candidatus Hadarchaeales archaeon]
WVRVEGRMARVGVTSYAQRKLGEVVYVELPEVGRRVRQLGREKTREMELGAVESIKAVSVVYSPLTGVVREVNEELRTKPELVNLDPYGRGWICLLEPESLEAELPNLMNSKSYREYLEKLGE